MKHKPGIKTTLIFSLILCANFPFYFSLATESSEMIEVEEENDVNEESMSSKEWLSRYGIEVHGLEIYDLLEGVAFKHKDGFMNLLVPPQYPEIRTSAVSRNL